MPPIFAEIGTEANNRIRAETSEKQALAFSAHRRRQERSGFSHSERRLCIGIHHSCQDRHPICDKLFSGHRFSFRKWPIYGVRWQSESDERQTPLWLREMANIWSAVAERVGRAADTALASPNRQSVECG